MSTFLQRECSYRCCEWLLTFSVGAHTDAGGGGGDSAWVECMF
jgi:hypothetical protein